MIQVMMVLLFSHQPTNQIMHEGLELFMLYLSHDCVYIVYDIESAAYGVLFTSCWCQIPGRASEGF